MQSMKLKRVLGFTTNGRNSFLTQPNTDHLIYVAGCVIVILKPKLNTQSHLISDSKHNITTLAITEDGRFLAAADCALKATIYLWDLASLTLVARFNNAHDVEITCMTFSSDGHLLVSIGSQHDMTLNLWDLRRQVRLTSAKISTKVRAVSFSQDNSYFVTVAEAQVKYWSLVVQQSHSLLLQQHQQTNSVTSSPTTNDDSGAADINNLSPSAISSKDSSSSTSVVVSLSCKSATLGEQKKNSFCDVKCGRGLLSGSTFCLTKSGLLCELNNSKRILHKWVDLRTSSASCLSLGSNLIVIGCANGVVRCFSATDLRFLKNLPKPHSLGKDDISVKKSASCASSTPNVCQLFYPSTIAIGFNEDLNTVACVYNNRSIYLWDLLAANQDHQQSRKYSALYHSSCIWGIDMYPPNLKRPLLPEGSFVTCSSDDTLRIWNPNVYCSGNRVDENQFRFKSSGKKYDDNSSYQEHHEDIDHNSTKVALNNNLPEVLKIIYTDSSYKFLCDLDRIHDRNRLREDDEDNNDNQNYDSNEGLRCVRFSPDGKHLAVGSRSGAIRIFDLSRDCEQIKSIAAHDAEVLCLDYSDANNFQGYSYLASSSRDKLIHIFDASKGYSFLQTIDDHSSSITAIRFVNNRAKDCLQLISCGADQKIIFRNGTTTTITTTANGDFGGQQVLHFTADQLVEGKNTFYDMEVDSESSCLMTACQDRMIRIFNIAQVKYQSGFRGSLSSEGTLIKIALDPTCTFLAASSTDKSISIYDYQRGECIASISLGLSDLLTDLKFSIDAHHLVGCSGDGCIFVWSSPAEMRAANVDHHMMVSPSSPSTVTCSSEQQQQQEQRQQQFRHQMSSASNHSNEQKARLKSLPDWAQQQMLDELERQKSSSSNKTTATTTNASNSDSYHSSDHLYEDIDRHRGNRSSVGTFNDSLNHQHQKQHRFEQSNEEFDIEYQVKCATTTSTMTNSDNLDFSEYTTISNKGGGNNTSSSGCEEFVLAPINRCAAAAADGSDGGLAGGESMKRQQQQQQQQRKTTMTLQNNSGTGNGFAITNDEIEDGDYCNVDSGGKHMFLQKSSGNAARGHLSSGDDAKVFIANSPGKLHSSGRSSSSSRQNRTTNTKLSSLSSASSSQLLQSRDNLEQIVSRERYIAEALQVVGKPQQRPVVAASVGAVENRGANASLSGLYNNAHRFEELSSSLLLVQRNEMSNSKEGKQRAGVGVVNKTATAAALSRSSHALNSRSMVDSSDDDDELSLSINNEQRFAAVPTNANHYQHDNLSNLPVPTAAAGAAGKLICSPSPKPLQRQSRRSSADYNHTTGNYLGNSQLNHVRGRTGGVARKLVYSSSVQQQQQQQQQQQSHYLPQQQPLLRSSKSECNLDSYSLLADADELADSNGENFNQTTLHTSSQHLFPAHLYCQKVDLSRISPAEAAQSRQLVQYVVDELQALSKYATRLHQKLSTFGKSNDGSNLQVNLSALVARGVQNSMDILSIVPQRAMHSSDSDQQQHRFIQQQHSHLSSAAFNSYSTGNRLQRQQRSSSQPRRCAISPVPAATHQQHHNHLKTLPSKTTTMVSLAAATLPNAERPSTGNSGSNQMNIDQVLEAYSDRLFKMVQERIGSGGGASSGHQVVVGAINNSTADDEHSNEQSVTSSANTAAAAAITASPTFSASAALE